MSYLIPLCFEHPRPPISHKDLCSHSSPFIRIYNCSLSLTTTTIKNNIPISHIRTTIMAKCASLQQIFENPLPPNPTLIESLSSWRHHIKPTPPDLSSVTELFGELQFKDHSPCVDQNEPPEFLVQTSQDDENCSEESKPPSFEELFDELCFKECFSQKNNSTSTSTNNISFNRHGRSKSAVSNDESSLGTLKNRHHSDPVNLQLCTEGLGFESFDVESNDSVNGDPHDNDRDGEVITRKHLASLEVHREFRELAKRKSFPPPISSIGGNGKPWLYFRSCRQDGRFILKQYRIPTHVFFNAYREGGRLRLHTVCPVEQPMQTDDTNTTEEEEDDNAAHELVEENDP